MRGQSRSPSAGVPSEHCPKDASDLSSIHTEGGHHCVGHPEAIPQKHMGVPPSNFVGADKIPVHTTYHP
eukprot:scaffold192099_cov17-Tisochrysis_lutea.AAC.2